MTFEQIIGDLKKKIYHPVYFLTGEETYFIDQISDFIEDHVLKEEEKDFNQTVLYGKDSNIETIISEAKRFPMMAEYNVVIVKEAQHIGDLDVLERYLEHPSPTTILVFCYKYKTIDKRKKVAKLLAKEAVFFESKKLYDNQLGPWVEDYVKSKKLKIEPKAILMLVEFLGSDLGKVANEIDKLAINLKENDLITPGTIEMNIGISKDYNNFELNNALGAKDVLKANKIINYFGDNPKSNPVQVTIATLYGFFSKILVYHYTQNKARNELAVALGVNPFFLKDYEVAARNYPIKKVAAIIGYLRDCDLKSKGINNTSTDQLQLLKELVFKILH